MFCFVLSTTTTVLRNDQCESNKTFDIFRKQKVAFSNFKNGDLRNSNTNLLRAALKVSCDASGGSPHIGSEISSSFERGATVLVLTRG